MIVKILDSKKHSWWMYDNLEKVRFGSGMTTDYIIVAKITGECGEGYRYSIDYDFRVVYHDGWPEDDVLKMDYDWAVDNIAGIQPNLIVIDDSEIKNGVNNTNWVMARKPNGDESLFVFNTLGFILNNDGKTIEKI